MLINTESALFTDEHIDAICKKYDARYIMDTERDSVHCAIFYSRLPHPDSGSRYFAMYITPWTQELIITDGSWIEDEEIVGIIADDGEIIYSRYRHDYRISTDESVFIDGGREYTRMPLVGPERMVRLTVFKGRLEVWFKDEK